MRSSYGCVRPILVAFLLFGTACCDRTPRQRTAPATIHEAAEKGDVEAVRAFLAKGIPADAKELDDAGSPIFGWRMPLHVAGSKEVVELLIANGADVNAKGMLGYMPLHHAVRRGSKDVAETLVAKGANIEAQNDSFMTPLFEAESKEIAEFLIAKGADVNAKAVFGLTPLHIAARYGRTEVAEVLIAGGAAINAKEEDGWTPLHFAAWKTASQEAAKLLILKGADVNAKSKSARTPLSVAKHDETRKLLKKHGAKE